MIDMLRFVQCDDDSIIFIGLHDFLSGLIGDA